MQIRLIQFVPDATIKVFAGADKIGENGGSMIQLVRPLVKGETIYVIQSAGICEGQTARVLEVQFVAPPLYYNPVKAWQRAIGPYYKVVRPDEAADWMIRFGINWLFPWTCKRTFIEPWKCFL